MFKKCTGNYGTLPIYYSDPSNSLWVWKYGSNYYVSAIVGMPLTVDSVGPNYMSGFVYNEENYWRIGSTQYLFKDATNGWVITSYLGYGMLSTQQWWKGGSNFTGTYTKQGTASSDKIVALETILGYESTDLFGEYDPVAGSGLTGKRYLGLGTYNYGTSKDFVETIPLHDGKPTYKSTDGTYFLWWDGTDSKWTISFSVGVKSATVGYWEKTGTVEGSYSRLYSGGGTAPEPASFALASPSYEEGEEHSSIYLSQVALWL